MESFCIGKPRKIKNMKIYYNDNSRECAEWLAELVKAGCLPPGDIDDRTIQEVSADAVRGCDRCHFFSPASADGSMRWSLLDGRMPESGRGRAPANYSTSQTGGGQLTMSGIFGRYGHGLSSSAALQSLLANRLQARLDTNGSEAWRKGGCANLKDQILFIRKDTNLGKSTTLSSSPMAPKGVLNPAHSRWLMGSPAEWDFCGVMAMQSCRRSRRYSSKRQERQ